MPGPRRFVEKDPLGTPVRMRPVTAAGAPLNPPDEWFADPGLEKATPLTVTADGRVYGHIAAWGVRHIGLPGNIEPPRSSSDYAFFKTGVVTASSGTDIPVGQITLAGGHAPLSADAGRAVQHYDDTASAVADVNVGEDAHGIWVAGGLRPNVDGSKIRALRASAPSGDWRPINGNLELVAVCQVNVPGFPVARARVASGATLALVAAGAQDMYRRRIEGMVGVEELEARVASLEAEATKRTLRDRVARKS